MSHQGPSFFKIILPLSEFSEQLRIPPHFVKNIDKEAFERATLRGPSGCCWPVKLQKCTGGVFLIDGWRRFFKAHSLKNYEFLVFEYETKTCFGVKIFGVDGLERANVPKNGNSGNERKNVGEETSNAKRKRGRPRKHLFVDGSGIVTKENGKFCSEFPFFEQKMDCNKLKRNNFYIPLNFSRRYLRNEKMNSKMILRNEKGKTWEVCVSLSRKGSYFNEGWASFLKENGLEEGDHCIFELVKKTEMQVHIFRSTKFIADQNGSALVTEVGDRCYQENEYFCSEFPFFEQYMDCKKLKRHDFYVPKGFSQKYLLNEKMILRNKKGNSWEVSVISCRSGTYFSNGWTSFTKQNKLKVGDRCIFQLVNKSEMQVHIFQSSNSGEF